MLSQTPASHQVELTINKVAAAFDMKRSEIWQFDSRGNNVRRISGISLPLKETTMNTIKKFLTSEDGPTAVEYAVMLALIIVVCIGTITNVGTKANGSFDASKTALAPI